MSIRTVRNSGVFIALLALTLLLPHPGFAQTAAPSVRELVPPTAPAGARVFVTGRGLADPAIAVAFSGASGNAAVVTRNDRFVEVVVPAAATSGNVRITQGAALIKEVPFTVAAHPSYVVSTVAGGISTGDAVFKEPYSAAVTLPDGTLYLADTFHCQVRKVTPGSTTSVVVAGSGSCGFANGAKSTAQFKEPRGIAWDPVASVLYVADTGNHAVRRVTLDGNVTTLAGGSAGNANGTGTAAKFKEPYGVAVDAQGNVYVADTFNHAIRKVTAAGVTTTIAGDGVQGHVNGAAASARFSEPEALCVIGGVVYVGDTNNHVIRKIENGTVSTLAGAGGSSGASDGSLTAARFNEPGGIYADERGNLVVADTENSLIRYIDLGANSVSRLAGSTAQADGHVDGAPSSARFNEPTGIVVAGAIYVTDSKNYALRRLCPQVRVTGVHSPSGSLAAGADVRVFGTGFVPGATTVKFNDVAATSVTWISATTLAVKLPAAISGASVSVVISSCGGTTAPTSFVIDNTAPVLTVMNGGVPLVDGSKFKVPVTPVISATDDFDPNPTIAAKLNNQTFVSNTTIGIDGQYTLYARAEDGAGNFAEATIRFLIDQTPPVVEVLEKTTPFPAGNWFNRPVVIDLKITDLTPTTWTAAIDGTSYTLKAPYAVEGTHSFTATVTDDLGNSTPVGPVEFTIDLTPPALTWTSHAQNQVLSTRDVTLVGGSDDAVTIAVNGVGATVDASAKTFTLPFSLAEGENVITATGTDRAGNTGTSVLKLVLDTRAPQLAIVTPAASLCTNANTLEVRGTVSDADVKSVAVKLGDATVDATLDAAKRNWTASIAAGADGRKSITVEATDGTNHTATEQVAIVVDRTEPALELQESGSPFTATLIGRKVALFVRATDADAAVTPTITLNGAAYTSGAEIAQEKTHVIRITASDCAGNSATREHTFTLDLTPPKFLTFTPQNGSKHTSAPGSLSGTTDSDAVEVRVIGRGIAVPVTNGSFTIPNIAFADGVNERSLEVVDRVGHTGSANYTIGVRTSQPLIDITERGESMTDNTLYTRAVEPRVRVFEDGITWTATLNNAPFTNGTVVSENGSYTITATANDPEFGTSNTVTRRFTIDRSAPAVKIVSPADGATFPNEVDRTPVVATANEAASVRINGIAATKQSDGNWTATVPLDLGENDLVAAASDANGNTATDSVTVTRGSAGPALVLTFPPNNYLTNRPLLDVTGRVLRPSSTVAVTVPPANAVSTAVDPAGAFRLNFAELEEGETTITAVATEGGKSTSVSVKVIADFTPPRVRILESDQPLTEGATFAAQAIIKGEATDKGEPIAFVLTIDGTQVTGTTTVNTTGGHTAVMTARDAAGNESRLERTFYIGSTSGGGCALTGFDPADGSVITQQKVELVGRSGGAAGVKVNGVPAKMASGSFCAAVELPKEGPNEVTIVCTDANGNPVGDEVRITLHRVTNDPSVTITFPPEGHVTSDGSLTVTGTLGNGAVSVELNGKPATISGSNWTATDVRLNEGINVLVAVARNAGGRTATASRRVTYIEALPAITITSPVPNFISGVPQVDVSGTWLNLDPNSLAVEGFNASIDKTVWSDTTGRFVVRNVPLTAGSNTIRLQGHDRTGRVARAEVVVKYTVGLATLSITSPADNHYFPANTGDTFRVSGSFSAPARSTIDVNGVNAAISGGTFTADVPFSTLSSGLTPVVARVAVPDGSDGAFDSLRVYKLAAPSVKEIFPAADAIEVDPGVVVLVYFSAPMDKASTVAAFRLENANGTPVSGQTWLDKDVLTFAPATTLTPGERYTIKIATTATDIASQNLTAAATQSFVVATTAATTAPTLTVTYARICEQTVNVTGTTAAGTRVELLYGTSRFMTTASAAGAFAYRIALTGQQGYHVIRVRSVGADGTYSPAAELKVNVDCTGPRVLSAAYDRTVNRLTIVFSRDVKPSTLTTGNTGSLLLVLNDGRVVSGDVTSNAAIVNITPAENLGASTFTLKVTTAVEDTTSRKLEFPHTQLFPYGEDEQPPADGRGFLTGEVYDATTGRPLAGAEITIDVPTSAFSRNGRTASTNAVTTQAVTMISDARGRYGDRFPEGVHTIRASANGYTTVWRQIIVPAGAGVIPIDIRLTARGETKTIASGETKLAHGGNKIARRAELAVPAGGLAAGETLTLTSTGAQSLAGLLPLGWSPLASAEIVSSATSLGAAKLTFDVPTSEIEQASQSLAAVRYDEARDEWRVLNAVVASAGNKATIDVDAPGAYALVYGDKRSGLAPAPTPSAGAPLQGVKDPCASGACAAMVAESFPLDPQVILPNGSTTATLNINGIDTADAKHAFPSGTAVQAYIDEELRLADGGRELDPPFATDLLLYRDLSGNTGVAAFTLAPSPRAAQVFLEVGFENIRILPYPGRLDRGTLIGSEGGRVPADEKVSVEIPTGATQVELNAKASSIADAQSLGPIAGFTIVGGLNFEIARVGSGQNTDVDGDGEIDVLAPVELTRPARATFTVDAAQVGSNAQLILVELIDQTVFGNRVFRLAAEMTRLDANRWTTKAIDRDVLPVDGVIREGRYLLLAAQSPIAFAKGLVRNGDGVAASGARVQTPGSGVADLSRLTGIFNIPVAAAPAAPFQLIPRIHGLGDGVTYIHPSAPAPAQVVNVGDLNVIAQPPQIASTIPAANATGVSPTTTVEVTFTPGIDASSVDAKALTVVDSRGFEIQGSVTAVGNLGIRWNIRPGDSLEPGTRYTAAVAGTVRGSNGTPLGQPYTFSFTTATVVTNDQAHPERIRISMPTPQGTATITGLSGALLKDWVAIPVRRGNDFFERYTAHVTNDDGSFTLTIGGGDPRDAITIADEIDLRVLNRNGALTAIIPLTPFVTPDGRGFIAPPKTTVTFHSADGIKVVVPAGSFETATMIRVEPLTTAAFTSVPNLEQELDLVSSVRLQFEGRAAHKLEVTLPIAAGTELHDKYILGLLGQSVRGPRIAPIDMLFASNGALTNKRPAGNNVRGALRASSNSLDPNADPQDFLMGVQESGDYAAFIHDQIKQIPYVWAFLDDVTSACDLFLDIWTTVYTSTKFRAEEGVIAFPVPVGTKFSITGIDPATALVKFQQPYNAIDGSGSVVLTSPEFDISGPHPVFGGPFRIETLEAPPVDVPVESVRNLKFQLSDGGQLKVMQGSVAFAESPTRVSVLDADTGNRASGASLPLTIQDVKPGHRLVVTIEEHDVDPASEIQVVFSEPIAVPAPEAGSTASDQLKKLIKLEQIPESSSADPIDLMRAAVLKIDSGKRRVSILLPSSLPTGEKFRLTLKKEINDQSKNKLGLGQAGKKNPDTGSVEPIGPAPEDMELWFSTSEPKGKLASFQIRQRAGVSVGEIRELSQYGNLLFVAAVGGGVLAYDTSDPLALQEADSKPVGVAPGIDDGSATAYWSVNVDHHGRVYTTGVGHMFGYFRSFRVEDFVNAEAAPDCGAGSNRVCNDKQIAAAVLSQVPGSGGGAGVSTVAVTYDRVEAVPRKMRIVVGDEPSTDYKRDEFVTAFGGSASGPASGLQRISAELEPTTDQHRIQRMTVENVTLGLRWSADARATNGGATLPNAKFTDIVAGPNDILRVTRNLTTHAVVNLFGYGMGVFDLNAIESNEQPQVEGTTGFSKPKEQVALRFNAYDPPKGVSASTITSISFSPHAEILATPAGSMRFYAYDVRKGVVEFAVALPENIYRHGEVVLPLVPRWKKFVTHLDGTVPDANVRFNSGALYRNPDTKKQYLLLAGVDAGLVVLQAGAAPMNDSSFADVVWFPQGAWAVRVIENTHNALVVDRKGAIHLVDLSRVDERDRVTEPDEMFPTALAAMLAAGVHGAPDPRILWSSPDGVAMGNVVPVMDGETGFFFSGTFTSDTILTKNITTGSAVDPQIKFMYDTGARLRETSSIVPLGIEAPKGLLTCTPTGEPDDECRASLGVFRVEAMLPGSLGETLGQPLNVAIESERVAGVAAGQTPEPYPVSHIRQKELDGTPSARPTASFALKRVLEPYASSIPSLRYQRGWNRFVSDWIVALADPRAAKEYGDAPDDCKSCIRPNYLDDVDTKEIYTTGRFLAVRPEFGDGSGYGWMGEDKRLTARVSTIPADTVRPRKALIAAQVPPVAEGMLQETMYVHSGEVETSNIDYDAGGRSGWNVVFDRTYRSRTIGLSPLGTGWESTMFRRLRALPNGDVEFRDGRGEIWRFEERGGEYKSPEGLFLRLSKGDSGWIMIDQQWRITRFDDLGRLVSESDEFYDPQKPGSGNMIVYTYDGDGRLSRIIDPVGRVNEVKYNDDGLVDEVKTWHTQSERKINYHYVEGRLEKVELPDVVNTSGSRPAMKYGYESAGGSYKDELELPNLDSITDPGETTARVEFDYESGGDYRDHVKSQRWAEGETASVIWSETPRVTDALGHARTYTLSENSETDHLADRAHVTKIEDKVETWTGTAFGNLPALLSPGAPATTSTPRTRTFGFEGGVLKTSELVGLRMTTTGYSDAAGAPGKVVSSSTTTPTVATAAPPYVPAQAPVARTFHYQTGDNASTFLSHVVAGGIRIDGAEAHRKNDTPKSENDNILESQTYDVNGRLTDSTSAGGTDSDSAGSKAKIEYWPDDAERHVRGLPHFIREGGNAELVTTIDYVSETEQRETDPRGVVTTTEYDTWNRPKQVRILKPGDPAIVERYAYDAAGRTRSITRAKGSEDVVTTYTYDRMGRQKTSSTNKIATVGTATTTTNYEYPAKRIVTIAPGGATTTDTLDGLGRVTKSVTETGNTPIEQHYAYDAAGNRVYSTDMYMAIASAYDVHGRVIATRDVDGTITTTVYDAVGNPTKVTTLGESGSETLSELTLGYTANGRLSSATSNVDATKSRSTAFAWDGAGRTTGVSTNGRAAKAKFDAAGRLVRHTIGEGTNLAISDAFVTTNVESHDGTLPANTSTTEKNGGTYSGTTTRDVAGNPKKESLGALSWEQRYDQLGNMTMFKPPARPPTEWTVDARGSVVTEKLGDGATNTFEYHGSGAQKTYTDPASEATSTTTDLLGRPTFRTYADGTTERIEWEGRRLKSVTDRQGRKQVYQYDGKGQIREIKDGDGVLLDVLTWKNGRLVSWKTRDTEVTWDAFNLDGAPRTTTQTRFRNHSGFEPAPAVLDRFTQTHEWNEHGERIDFTMPKPEGGSIPPGWTASVHHDYDAMGNVKLISRGTTLMSASYHGAGRPKSRTVTTSGGVPIVRNYGYDDSSLMNRMSVDVPSGTIAGSSVSHDGLQTHSVQLLGVASGERYTHYRYDARGRVAASVVGGSGAADPFSETPGRAIEVLTPADFRSAQERLSRLDAATAGALASRNVDTSRVDPPSAQFEKASGGGHKIGKTTKGARVYPYGWNGAERISDGRFTYKFDVRGNLISATEIGVSAPKRRILYTYSGTGRLVARRAEYTTEPSPSSDDDWRLEDRPAVFAADGLPADTTFVWDPISDNLLSVYKAGAPADDVNGGLLKQVIHGGASYDDPIETTTADPFTGAVTHLYPVYDEAAAGSLQVVVNRKGEVVARTLQNDAYGADNIDFSGAAIDAIDVTVRKTAAGAIENVIIRMHATEELSEGSVAAGARLASVTGDDVPKIVRTSPVGAEISDDGYALEWTLTAAQWDTLIDSSSAMVGGVLRTPVAVSIAATYELRAKAWGTDVPVMPAPEWVKAAKPVYTNVHPVEIREALPSLKTFAVGAANGADSISELYRIDSLPLAAASPGDTPVDDVFAARMHAHPFTDAATNLNYVRSRWYDPITGTWLSPDPLGYVDSSNLYSFAGGDPVNRRDPTGSDAYDNKLQAYIKWYSAQQDAMWREQQRLDEAYKQEVAGNNDVGTIVADRNIVETRRMTFGGGVDTAAMYFEAARARGDRRCLSMTNEQLYVELRSDEAVKSVPLMVVPAMQGVVRARATRPPAQNTPQATPANSPRVNVREAAPAAQPQRKALPAPKNTRVPQDVNVNPNAPPAKATNRPVGKSPTQNAQVQADIAEAQRQGATNILVNQQQVNAQGQRVGTNRPDLQYTRSDGVRVYVEYDTSASTRGAPHASRILANDPNGVVITKTVN